uniref:CSON013054 protein n=1 Tax=Culicoides sonorensis TaxID=179676 RepID=A0A336M701_CULSO
MEIDLIHPLSDEKIFQNIRDNLFHSDDICRFCFAKENEVKNKRLIYFSHVIKACFDQLSQDYELSVANQNLSDKICEACSNLIIDAWKVQNAVIESQKKLLTIYQNLQNNTSDIYLLDNLNQLDYTQSEIVVETQNEEDISDIFYHAPTLENPENEFIEELQNSYQSTLNNSLENQEGYSITRDENGKKQYACTKCNKKYCKKFSLDYHFRHNSNHNNGNLGDAAKCDECTGVFYDVTTLKRHKAMVHDLKKTPCKICQKEFNAYHMNLHMKRHLKKNHACPYCPNKYCESNYQLQEHLKLRHSTEKTYKCDFCSDTFATKFNLLNHLKKNHPDIPKPFHCDICGQGVYSKQALTIHYRKCLAKNRQGITKKVKPQSKSNPVERFSCTTCTCKFKTKFALNIHEQRHLNQELHICTTCEKSFSQKKALKVHIQSIHLKEFEFFCKECNRGFINAAALRQHEKIHTDEKDFKCQFCYKAFNRHHTLKIHIEKLHRNRRYRCKYCLENGYIREIKNTDIFIKHIKESHIYNPDEDLNGHIIESDIPEVKD